jgi:hypothetical protein
MGLIVAQEQVQLPYENGLVVIVTILNHSCSHVEQ